MDILPKVLAISGSLRANSSNNAVIQQCAAMLQGRASVTIYDGIGKLPHFDDSKLIYPEVERWRQLIVEHDGVLICQPEYAFGVAGSLKNALDWTVSTGELVYKPLALITAATGGDKAHAALLHTFTALSAKVTEDTSLLIPFIRAKMNTVGQIADAATVKGIAKVLDALLALVAVSKD